MDASIAMLGLPSSPPLVSGAPSRSRVSLRARSNQHFVFSGRSLLVTNLDGVITGSGSEGLYYQNTRLIACEEFRAGGKPLSCVSASPADGNTFLAYLGAQETDGIPAKAVYCEVAHRLGNGLWTELRLQNYALRDRAHFDLAILLSADFADIEEAIQGKRQQTAGVAANWDSSRRELMFRYSHPELQRAVAVRVDQAPISVSWADDALHFDIDLEPHQAVEVHLAVEPVWEGKRLRAPRGMLRVEADPLEETRTRLLDEAPALTTTNPTVARAWRTAIRDLAALPLGQEAGPATPIAGVPLYQQFFGRDTLTTAWQALPAMPSMMRDTLLTNAAYQGQTIDDWLDEEPGKLIHQAGGGPLASLGINPFRRYYGDYATPPDFLIMLGQYLTWTNDLATARKLLPVARKAIDWLDRYGDLDHDGFIEYVCRSEKGVKNQGWKDSNEGIIDERGEIVENPIVASELQAYWYVGLQQAAIAFFLAGDRGYALDLLAKARALRQRFDRAFWMEDEGFYALALGPDKRPIKTIASNAGHLLAAGIVPRAKAKRVARRLMAPELFSGWGVRTLSSEHPAYNPFSYHLGSVWPVENGTFALGFARYGFVGSCTV
jgi:glycogen debranching enzyme